jgi:hypothetical protein
VSYLVALPSVHRPWTDACLATMKAFDRQRIAVVDNTVRNRGVAASWNLVAREVLASNVDWLVIVSAGMRFEAPWGADFLCEIEARSGAIAVEGGMGIGWHCLGVNRRTLERVGLFDENYFPGYWEDVDFSRRVMLAGLTEHADRDYWPKVPVEAYVRGFGHAMTLGGKRYMPDAERLLGYYERKWQGRPGAERAVLPFGDRPLEWWPEEGHEWATPRQ